MSTHAGIQGPSTILVYKVLYSIDIFSRNELNHIVIAK